MRTNFYVLFLLVGLGAGGFCRNGLGRANRHDAGSPRVEGNGSACAVIAHGSFDCSSNARDPETFVNNGPGVGTITMTGGAKGAKVIACECEAEQRVSLGHWNCRCPLARKGTAAMNYRIACEGESTGTSFIVAAPTNVLSFHCR
jgi:hypothetical protein